jgi:hypothetical protein
MGLVGRQLQAHSQGPIGADGKGADGRRIRDDMTVHTTRTSREGMLNLDPVWRQVRAEAEAIVAREPELAGFVYANVLNHGRLEDAITHRIATRLDPGSATSSSTPSPRRSRTSRSC